MVVLLLMLGVYFISGVLGEGTHELKIPNGSPIACLRTYPKTERFQVLPGIGWDNLRNKEAGFVVVHNYSQCRTTDDGRFLIPDSVNTIPLKQSKVNVYAELINHWTNYTSVTSRDVNLDTGLTFDSKLISGKFSTAYESVKSKQIKDGSHSTRVHLRYVRYIAMLQPDTELHPSFKSRLLNIAIHLGSNRTDHARYQSELLVRDFGTHVITNVNAGAALIQEDQIALEFVKSNRYTKNEITAAATSSMFFFLKINASYASTHNQHLLNHYLKHRSSSQIITLGGPMLKAINQTVNDWSAEVDRDLVAVDRSGDPIFFLINEATLPELPAIVVSQVYHLVQDAVKAYYEFNTYRGCTNTASPNFSPAVNLEDGTCSSPYTNMTFGGVFQTCISSYSGYSLCEGKRTVNPKTGTFSCAEGYEAVQLHRGYLKGRRSYRACRGFLFFCQWGTYYHSTRAIYTMYWCAAKGPVKQRSGFLFGGLYTSILSNPMTQLTSCPVNFYPLLLGTDLKICISDDFELGMKFAIPFGGFFSCTAGNLLAMEKKPELNEVQSLQYHIAKTGHSPKHCPKGYSQHLAYMAEGCAINYCVKSGALSSISLPTIIRPPFETAPLLVPGDEDIVMYDPETKQWRKNEEDEEDGEGGDVKQEIEPETVSLNPQPVSQNAGGMYRMRSELFLTITLIAVPMQTL